MRTLLLLLLAAVFSGCATRRPTAQRIPSSDTPVANIAPAAEASRRVETRYEVRAYRDAGDPAIRHDAHAVYRTTVVPARVAAVETMPRSEFAPASYAPLPANTELVAELAAQRAITEQLRAIRAHVAAVEAQAQGQYGALVNQTAETVKLRQQLEAERARMRELEAKLQAREVQLNAAVAANPAPPSAGW